MKWKMMFVVMLLVAAGCTVTLTPDEAVRAEKEKVLADAVRRIAEYKIVKEEQQLMKDILQLRYEAAVLNSKMRTAQPRPDQPEPVKEPDKE